MRRMYPALILASVLVLAYWKVLFHPEFTLLTGGDMVSQTYPWFEVASYWLKRGVLLLWDPYVYFGKANLGELQPGILYPLNWVFMLLPSAKGHGTSFPALDALILVHYFLAALFCFYLALSFGLSRLAALLTAVTFALGGFMQGVRGYVNIFSGFVWLPLILLYYRKAIATARLREQLRAIAPCALFLALSFLAGHHVPPIQAGLLLLFYTVFHIVALKGESDSRMRFAPFVTLAALVSAAALLASVQWLPSLEWAQRAIRWAGNMDPIRWGERIPYSVLGDTGRGTPQDGLSLVIPFASVDSNLYSGSIVLFFALIGILFARAREARFFTIAALGYFLLSWGQSSALHGWLNTFIPGVWFAREAFHYLIPFQLSLALLAGWGLDCLLENYQTGSCAEMKSFIRRAGWSIAALSLISWIMVGVLRLVQGMNMSHLVLQSSAFLGTYLLLLGFLLFFLHTGRITPARIGQWTLALVVLDLASHVSQPILRSDRPWGRENPSIQSTWQESPLKKFFQEARKKEIFRIDDPMKALPPNFGDAWRVEEASGHGATALSDYMRLRDMGWGPTSNISSLMNVRYFVSRDPVPGLERIFDGGVGVYANPRALPRAFAVRRFRLLQSDGELLRWLGSPIFSPARTVLLRDADIRGIDPNFLRSLTEESSEAQIVEVDALTRSEKESRQVADPQQRHRLAMLHPPWGWTTGDDLKIRFRIERAVSALYARVRYYSPDRRPSRLQLRLTCVSHKREESLVPMVLREGSDPAKLDEEGVGLGSFEPGLYDLYLRKTEECSANLDSVDLSNTPPVPETEDPGEITITSFRPNGIRLRASLRQPALVVISEIQYPGWTALVDNHPVSMISGDFMLRTVPVPAGTHEIDLKFRPESFRVGLLISMITLGALLILWRTRRASPA